MIPYPQQGYCGHCTELARTQTSKSFFWSTKFIARFEHCYWIFNEVQVCFQYCWVLLLYLQSGITISLPLINNLVCFYLFAGVKVTSKCQFFEKHIFLELGLYISFAIEFWRLSNLYFAILPTNFCCITSFVDLSGIWLSKCSLQLHPLFFIQNYFFQFNT